jgi:hypothetical protein
MLLNRTSTSVKPFQLQVALNSIILHSPGGIIVGQTAPLLWSVHCLGEVPFGGTLYVVQCWTVCMVLARIFMKLWILVAS